MAVIGEPPTLAHPADFTTPEVFQIIGYLTVALPELHQTDCAVVCERVTEAMAIIRAERTKPQPFEEVEE